MNQKWKKNKRGLILKKKLLFFSFHKSIKEFKNQAIEVDRALDENAALLR